MSIGRVKERLVVGQKALQLLRLLISPNRHMYLEELTECSYRQSLFHQQSGTLKCSYSSSYSSCISGLILFFSNHSMCEKPVAKYFCFVSPCRSCCTILYSPNLIEG